MRIPYQFGYSAHFMLKDGKKPVSRTVVETSEVEIPELTGQEAPVAARWRQQLNGRADAQFSEMHVRTYAGACYQPYAQERSSNDEVPPPIAEIVGWNAGSNVTAGKTPPDSQILHRLGDDRDEKVRRIERRLADIILVDGMPYFRCVVPKVEMCLDADRCRADIITDHLDGNSYSGKSIDRALLAPLADYETVVERAASRGLRVYRGETNIEVLVPEALEYDKKAEAIGRTVGQAIADNESQLYRWPRHLAEEFLDIREGYGKWLDDQDSADIVELLERTYAVFTQGTYYNQSYVASFLANYDEVQKYIPEMEISLDIGRQP